MLATEQYKVSLRNIQHLDHATVSCLRESSPQLS